MDAHGARGPYRKGHVVADTLNSFGARETLNVGGKSYTIYNLEKAAAALGADLDKLPFAHRILL